MGGGQTLPRVTRSCLRRSTHTLPQVLAAEHGTHHLVTADAAGNVVSLTTTVNRIFGSQLTTRHGVVLNDELDDFTQTKQLGELGLTRNPNRARPGARPVSSMSPTIVTRGDQAVFALGGSGGMAIATNVTQVLFGRLVFNLQPQALVSAPRFFVPPAGPTIFVAEDASQNLIADLESRGEVVRQMTWDDTTAVQVLMRDGAAVLAAADPRKFGVGLTQ